MAYVRARRGALEQETGFEIELVQDAGLGVAAKAEVAWHHGRSSHVVRYRLIDPTITPHLVAHELEHIAMEQAARDAGRNRFFTTDPETREQALRMIGSDLYKLKRSGMSEQMIEEFTERILAGLANQLFNAPLDMIIEYRLWHDHPALRPSQVTSLYVTHRENVTPLEKRDIKQMTPNFIYTANLSMNAAYAIFMDHLLGGRTNYAAAYQSTRYYRSGRRLFTFWLEMIDDYEPGDEYDLVDRFAAELNLEGWYAWHEDKPRPVEEAGGITNEELLRLKLPAATMYCLDALQRFEEKSRDEIYEVVSEIAIMGRSGLDYASSDAKYTLRSIPGKQFSGLQLMCLMYVGFKEIEPTLDTGVDLREPYEQALAMHEAGH
jgi:hypothetical protein